MNKKIVEIPTLIMSRCTIYFAVTTNIQLRPSLYEENVLCSITRWNNIRGFVFLLVNNYNVILLTLFGLLCGYFDEIFRE